MGNLIGNVFIVILSLVIFFSTYPVVDAVLGAVIGDLSNTREVVIFMMEATGFVLLTGVLKWVYEATISTE